MAYLGKTPSQAVRQRYIYTASGSETSISGADDNGNTLTYTDGGYVDVYLNGVLLVAGTDYNTTTANTIGGLTALSASDVVEIVVYDVFSVFGGDVQGDLTVSNGRLQVGDTDDPQGQLHVVQTGDLNTSGIWLEATDGGISTAPDITTYRNSASPAVDDNLGSLWFYGNDDNGDRGLYAGMFGQVASPSSASGHSGRINFYTSNNGVGAERVRINEDGVFLVGTTDIDQANNTTPADCGPILKPEGQLQISRDGGVCTYLNRLTSDGAIAVFRKDGTTVGSIETSTTSSNICFNGASGEAGIELSGSAWLPLDNGTRSDGGVDLGASTVRFRNAYISDGIYFGATSSSSYMDDYEEGAWVPVAGGTSTAGTFSAANASGRYIKVGNMVTAWCYFTSASLSGAAGNLQISGLPFTARATTPGVTAGYAGRLDNIDLPAGAVDVSVVLVNNSDTVTFRCTQDNTAIAYITDVSWAGNVGISFNITYPT